MRFRSLSLLAPLTLVACAGAQTPTPATPASVTAPPSAAPAATSPAPAEPPKPDPFAIGAPLRAETPVPDLDWTPFDPKSLPLAKSPAGIPAAPKECAAYARRKPTKPAACAERSDALAALDAAMGESDPSARDAALSGLEACAGLPAGLARALRADLAPVECGDAIAEPMLKAPPPGLSGPVYHALYGQALAARLSRTVGTPPRMAKPFDKKHVLAFIKGPLGKWMVAQAKAIEAASQAGAGLVGYGRGIAAIEAGVADLRFVDAVRGVPLPEEFARDIELKDAYYGALDQALDPRKDRGRDAALVGLRDFAVLGALRDPRVDRARTLLSKLYGGRRIDALDGLLLPPLADAAPSTVEERLASRLPSFYTWALLDPAHATTGSVLRALLERGVPPSMRRTLDTPDLPTDLRTLYARASLRLGELYWRAVDFDRAVALTSSWPTADRPDDATFLLALGLGLRGGPEDAAALMRHAPHVSLGMEHTGPLDFVATREPAGPFAGLAAFDGAWIEKTSPPDGAGPEHFRKLAARFRAAERLLPEAAQKIGADEQAREADAIADAAR